MTSWKRLFGKKTKKAHRKVEQKFDQWLKDLHDHHAVHPAVQRSLEEMERRKKSSHNE